MKEENSPEMMSAYQFVDKMVRRTDGRIKGVPVWYGWALREAFLEGIKWQDSNKRRKADETN